MTVACPRDLEIKLQTEPVALAECSLMSSYYLIYGCLPTGCMKTWLNARCSFLATTDKKTLTKEEVMTQINFPSKVALKSSFLGGGCEFDYYQKTTVAAQLKVIFNQGLQ